MVKFITEPEENKEADDDEEDNEDGEKNIAVSSDSSDLPEHAVQPRSPRAIEAPKDTDGQSDSNLSNYSFDLAEEEIAALKKQYDTMSKDDKFEEEMMFKGMVKEEILDNKRRKRV